MFLNFDLIGIEGMSEETQKQTVRTLERKGSVQTLSRPAGWPEIRRNRFRCVCACLGEFTAGMSVQSVETV